MLFQGLENKVFIFSDRDCCSGQGRGGSSSNSSGKHRRGTQEVHSTSSPTPPAPVQQRREGLDSAYTEEGGAPGTPAPVQQRRDGLDSAYTDPEHASSEKVQRSTERMRRERKTTAARKAKHRVLDSANSVTGGGCTCV